MKDLINNWKKSSKYLEFQFKLNQAKQKAFEIKSHILTDENIESTTDEQLDSFIDIIKELDGQFVDDEHNFDYNYFSVIGTESEIILEYLQKQKVWFIYLNRCLKEEKYELAAKLRDAIKIEKRLLNNLIFKYRPELISDEFNSKIDLVENEFYNIINDGYKY